MVDLFAFREQLVELDLAEHRAQRRLRQLARRVVVVLDLDDRLARVHHAEVDDRVDLDRDVVARDDVLRRHVVDDRPQRHPDHAVDDRDQQEQARAVVVLAQPPQPEHDAALVLGQDPHRLEQQEQREQKENPETDHNRRHQLTSSASPSNGSTVNTMSSTPTTRTLVPSATLPAPLIASQVSPCTKTLPCGANARVTVAIFS